MAFEKRIISQVPYSDETADFFAIELLDYSEKSFAFAFKYINGKTFKTLTPEEKDIMEEVKFFLGPTEAEGTADSLGGKGGTRFTYPAGNFFFGYVYSKSNGQKALDWFASRSETLPERHELKEDSLDEEERSLEGDELEEAYNIRARKTAEELYDLLKMAPKRVASRTQSRPMMAKGPGRAMLPSKPMIRGSPSGSPRGTIRAPTRSSPTARSAAPAKIKINIKGVPILTKPKEAKKEVTMEQVNEAYRTILAALNQGLIDSTYELKEEFPNKEGKINLGYVGYNRGDELTQEYITKNQITTEEIAGNLGPEVVILSGKSE